VEHEQDNEDDSSNSDDGSGDVVDNDEYDPCEEFETEIVINEFLFDSLIIWQIYFCKHIIYHAQLPLSVHKTFLMVCTF